MCPQLLNSQIFKWIMKALREGILLNVRHQASRSEKFGDSSCKILAISVSTLQVYMRFRSMESGNETSGSSEHIRSKSHVQVLGQKSALFEILIEDRDCGPHEVHNMQLAAWISQCDPNCSVINLHLCFSAQSQLKWESVWERKKFALRMLQNFYQPGTFLFELFRIRALQRSLLQSEETSFCFFGAVD